MLAENWDVVQDLFGLGLELPPDRRNQLLAGCDREITQAVADLWLAHDRAGDFLQDAVVSTSTGGGAQQPFPRPDDADDLGLERIGPYRILRELGRGGMGTVYLGLRDDGQFVQEVAIKVIKRGLDTDEIVRRFRSERQILAGLEHPGIARLLDGGSTADGRPYLVLERVQGERIDDWCNRHGLGEKARLELFRKVCDSVSHAHSQLVVHRDIKPGNILVTSDGVPKLLDFGVARVLLAGDKDQTCMAQAAFTPEYASPEQLAGANVSTTTDVYSLGVVLYELLTGRRPEDPPQPPTWAGEAQPARRWPLAFVRFQRRTRDLDTVLLKALRSEPEERYPSVEQFAADLDRCLRNEPILARPSTRAYRARKFVLRHKPMVAAGAAFALGLALTTAWALRETRIARQERARAEEHSRQTRQLANTLLFRIYDEIHVLPGALKVREDLVREGLLYLDKLSAEGDRDLTLRYELASGYRRLAMLQGDPFNSSKGDTAGALSSLKKALRLQESVVAASPRLLAARQFLAVLYDDESRLLPTLAESRAALARSLEIDRELLAEQPNSENRFQLAIALLHSSGFYQTPDTLETGIAQLQQSLTLFDQLASEGLSSLDFRAQHAFAHKRMGAVISFVRHDYAAGGRNYREALAIDQSLVDEHPERADLRYNLTQTQNDLAVVDTEEGRFDEALTGIHSVLTTREAMLAAEPADVRMRDGVASALQTLSDVLMRQKHYTDALAAATRSVEVAENGRRTDSIRVARGWYRMGNADLGLAKAAPAGAREHLDEAARYLEQARVLYRKLAQQRALGPNDAGMEKLLDQLLAEVRRPSSSLKPPGVFRTLIPNVRSITVRSGK